jgi:single-stranded-DNA-specific exonuclease
VVDGIIFRCEDTLPERIRAVYRLELNEFQGTTALQLVIEFWTPA